MSSYIGKININNTEYPIAQSLFGTSNTTANTATKVVTCADFDTLISGIVINVYFTYANTESSISLNVNSTGNKTVYVDNNSSILWDAGATKSFVYYSNQWRLINPTSVGTTYDAATTTAAGLMSAADKIKLNGITTGASTYAAGSGLSLSGTTFNHTNSITASSVGSSAATSGATLDVPYAKYDAQGHITEKGVHVHTIGSLAASAITSGTFATARIPNLPTSIITSGTFATARIPNLPASIITSGTLGTAILPTVPVAKGGTGATTAAAARTNLGLGSAAVASTSASVDNNTNLPTGAAIQSYVTGLGYEANQNAFTTVKVGTTDLVADSKTDTLTITAGNNITLTPTASSDSFSIAATNTTYSNATSSAAGLMSAADKQTLDGLVASGGEVNQNAFSNVVVGSSTVAADQKTDTLTLVGSGAVSISANTSTDTITITGTNTTYGTATTTTAGLMSASDKIKLNGVPTSVFKTIKVGTTNLIADNAEDTLTITAGDNITLTPTASSDSFSIAATNTTYAVATTAANGLMSATDKATLDGLISSGGEVNQNAFSNVVIGSSTVAADQKTDTLTLVGNGSVSLSANTSTDTITISGTNTTYGTATTAAAGLMSAEDKIKIDKTIHQLSTLSTVSADDQIAIYDVSNNTTGKSTLATAIEKAGFVPKQKNENGDDTNIINNSYGARIGHYGSDDWNYIMSIGSLTTVNGSTVMREGIEFQWQKPNYDLGDWWINRVTLGQDGIKANLDFGNINITSTNSTKVSPQITASNLAQIKIGNTSATSAFCVNDNIIGLYDNTNADWIIKKDVTEGIDQGTGTTYYGTTLAAPYSQAYLLRGSTSSTQHRLALTGYGNIRVDTSIDGGQNWVTSYYATHNGDSAQDPLPIERGGTGASNISDARNNLQVPSTANVWLASTSRTANTVLAAPNGSAGGAGFRSLVAADLPTVTIAKGGTGATDRLTAFKNLTNQNVGSAAKYFVSLTTSWESAGYSSIADTCAALGIKATRLWNGSMQSGSATFSFGGYNAYIVLGKPSGGSFTSLIIPAIALGTSDIQCMLSDETTYISFKLKYSGSTGTITYVTRTSGSNGTINYIYGIK